MLISILLWSHPFKCAQTIPKEKKLPDLTETNISKFQWKNHPCKKKWILKIEKLSSILVNKSLFLLVLHYFQKKIVLLFKVTFFFRKFGSSKKYQERIKLLGMLSFRNSTLLIFGFVICKYIFKLCVYIHAFLF